MHLLSSSRWWMTPVTPRRARADRCTRAARIRSAAPRSRAGPPGFEPGPARLELAMLLLTPQAYERTGASGRSRTCASTVRRVVLPLTPQRHKTDPNGWRRLCRRQLTKPRSTRGARPTPPSRKAKRCEGVRRVAAPVKATTPERTEGEGVEPPRPEAHPFSRRDTAPVAVLPMAPAGVEPAPRRLRVGSSLRLSYGAWEMWPAGFEPAARRVSGDRSTG